MLPSDSFVRFYNEVFKYLHARGVEELNKYYIRVSENQEFHCLSLFREKGLKGMYEYWEHIRIEENCDMTHEYDGKSYHFFFHSCPSLSKVLDNDASPCPLYCNHCPGWILPIMSKCGYYAVYNIISRSRPQCEMYVFGDKKLAEEKCRALASQYDNDVLLKNF